MSNAVGQVVCDLVHIAPAPIFAGLNGTDHWVLRGMEMFGGVLIFGRVTATDVAAGEANSQVNPPVAGFHAIFTNMVRGLEIAGAGRSLIKVRGSEYRMYCLQCDLF